MACYYDVTGVLTPALAVITGATIAGVRLPFFSAIKVSGLVLLAATIFNAVNCGDLFFALHKSIAFFLTEISTIFIAILLLAWLDDWGNQQSNCNLASDHVGVGGCDLAGSQRRMLSMQHWVRRQLVC